MSVKQEWGISTLETLINRYWNEDIAMFNASDPNDESNQTFHYWWQAHAADTLLDGYLVTKDDRYLQYVSKLHSGVMRRNGGLLFNDYYDDMSWMALALLRAYKITGQAVYLENAQALWQDIRGAWDERAGGGLIWRKNPRDYKNSCTSGPATILAIRLYTITKKPEYLNWAIRIYSWLDQNLVDPDNYLILDGLKLDNEGGINRPTYTYNQGTYVGASVLLWESTGDSTYLERAKRTANAVLTHMTDENGIFIEVGKGDGGLFKGILVRYFALLDLKAGCPDVRQGLLRNTAAAWAARTPVGTIGPRWQGPPHTGSIDLSAHLSATMALLITSALESSALG